MVYINTKNTLRARLARFTLVSALALSGGITFGQGWQLADKLTLKADASLKEMYDSNVYLQDVEPDPVNVAAAKAAGFHAAEAKKESFVTSITPKVALDYLPCTAFGLSVSYAPEMAWYHSASSEDYVAHRAALNLSGKIEETKWELLNSFTAIDGSDIGPVFAGPGEITAVGGIPLRNRRDAFVFLNTFRVTQPIGRFFLRPIATTYVHDFGTKQLPSGPGYAYENYIDRQNVNGGLDLGIPLGDQTHLIIGYRYGQQDQFKLRGTDSPYDRNYHRLLVGVEGSPVKWLKLSLLGGPDISDYDSGTPASFDEGETVYYIDSSITFLPTSRDTIKLSNLRYQQPAFGSPSVYEDITYSVTWKHKFDDQWSAHAGFQAYIGDWQAPAVREDWIYTPSVGVTYVHDKHLAADLGYSYDWVESKVANTAGREFTRHLVWLSAKYTF